jgi:putative nucleotidyltransferase with HDIG domain
MTYGALGIGRTPGGAKSVSLRAVPLTDDGNVARNKTSFRRPATSVNVPPLLPSLGLMNNLAPWAQQLARALLQEPLPRRWAHVQGVAARASNLAPVLGADVDLLEAAAWLHDIGYAPDLAVTGLHQLDGARYLRDA